MKLRNRLTILILLVVAISSCSVNNSFIQKRKYKKGYHLSMKKKISNSNDAKKTEVELNQDEDLAKNTSITNKVIKKDLCIAEESLTSEELTIKKNITKEKTSKLKAKQKNTPIVKGNSKVVNRVKQMLENNPIVKSNTADKSKSNDSDVVTIVLIVLLVLLALALFAFIDGILGGLLSLILLIIGVVLLLKYFDVI